MATVIALLGFNDLRRSVTTIFLFRNGFYLQLSPHCPKMNKKSMWEVKKISRLLSTGVTKPRHKGGRSLTNKNTKHKQTRENTQQLNISLQIFIKTTTLLINLHEYNN